ncbi:MAG: hypothetical protein FJ297_14220 [Planctomycetes bacterium]|nr:hypothetical protein [Planctomycetota bacterium]
MKKPSFGAGGIQGALVRHVEKIVFGACVTLFLLLTYVGFSLKGYTKVPQQVRELADQARANVDRDTWENIQNDPERVTLTKYSESVKEGNVPTVGNLYPYNQPLNPFIPRPLVKRKDPQLFPPVQLIVRAINAPVAFRNEAELPDRLAELKTATVGPQKPKTERRSNNRRGGFPASGPGAGGFMPPGEEGDGGAGGLAGPDGAGGAGGLAGPGGFEGGGIGGGSTPRVFRKPEGWRPGGAFGAGGMMGGGMMGGMGNGMRSGPGGLGPPPGGEPDGGPMGPGSGPGSGNVPPSEILSKPSHIVCVLALIPYEKELDEYKHVLENAVGYDPRRDQPNYVAVVVERAEVPADPSAELAWTKVGSTNDAFKEVAKWAGTVEETANPLYVLPRTSMPIPPIMLRDVDEFVDHPEIPRKHQQLASNTPGNTGPQPPDSGDAEGDIPGSDVPSGRLPGMGGGYPGMPSGPGGGAGIPGMPSGPGGGAGIPGMPGGEGDGGAGLAGPSGGGMAGGMMSGPGGMMGGMGGMGGMSYGGMQVTSEFKLLRFFDFTAEPGKEYKYRVQVLVEDPNHPQDRMMDVSARMLADDVASRVADLQSKEPKDGARQQFFRRSDWSEASEAVRLPLPERFYVGPTVKAGLVSHKNGAQMSRDWHVVKTASVVWDETWGIDVAVEKDAFGGGVLNQKGDIEAVHPLNLEFKILKDYDLRANSVLVDVRGGETVGGEKSDPLLAPNECVFLDSEGNIVVRNEIADLDAYRRYAFVEDEPSSDMGSGGMPGMGGPGEPGGMGGPGGMMPSGPGGMPGGMFPSGPGGGAGKGKNNSGGGGGGRGGGRRGSGS